MLLVGVNVESIGREPLGMAVTVLEPGGPPAKLFNSQVQSPPFNWDSLNTHKLKPPAAVSVATEDASHRGGDLLLKINFDRAFRKIDLRQLLKSFPPHTNHRRMSSDAKHLLRPFMAAFVPKTDPAHTHN